MYYNYTKADASGFACNSCGTAVHEGAEILVCPDCAAIFCRACCEDGSFDSHICDEDE